MAWIEVHQTLRDHRKLLQCADALNVEPVKLMGMLISLWLWALDNAPDGNLSGISEKTIARVMYYPEKKAASLVKTLVAENWLEQKDGVLAIHDWSEYAGRLMERREKDRARKKSTAPKKKAEVHGNSAGIPPEIQGKSPEIPALPYLTVPNRTLPNHTKPSSSTDTASHALPGTPPAQASASVSVGKYFSEFWEAYPCKIDREAAYQTWITVVLDEQTVWTIMDALNRWKRSDQWTEDGGRYIPRAAKFLEQRHWESPPAEAIPKGASGVLGEAEIEAIHRMMREG